MRFIIAPFLLALAFVSSALAGDDDGPSACAECTDTICPPHYKGGLKYSYLPLVQNVDTPKGGKLKAFRILSDNSVFLEYWFRYTLSGPRNDLNASVLAIRYLKSVVGGGGGSPRKRTIESRRSLADDSAGHVLEKRIGSTTSNLPPKKKDADQLDKQRASAKATAEAEAAADAENDKDMYTDFKYYLVQNGLICGITSPIKNKGNEKVPLEFFAADIHYSEYNLPSN